MPRLVARLLIAMQSPRFPLARLATLLSIALVSSSCSKAVVLRNDAGVTLRYRCRHVQAQAETIEELQLLGKYAGPVARNAAANQRYGTAMSIRDAYQSRDFPRLESVVVGYICEYGYPDGSS